MDKSKHGFEVTNETFNVVVLVSPLKLKDENYILFEGQLTYISGSTLMFSISD